MEGDMGEDHKLTRELMPIQIDSRSSVFPVKGLRLPFVVVK
jgi:hypothetical protein